MMNHKPTISEHFSWHRHPFTDTWRLDRPFLSAAETRTFSLASSLIKMGKGFALCGPSGSGKTSFLGHFTQTLDTRHYRPCTIPYGGFNRAGVLKLLADAMGVDASGRRTPLVHRLHTHIQQLSQQQQSLHPVLIIDDAQHLERPSLLDLCALIAGPANTVTASIILVGDQSLAKQLSLSVMAPVYSRLATIFLQPLLSEEETNLFINHRLDQARAKRELFQPDAVSLIAAQTSGNRRQIMNLATLLLQEAYERGEQTVSSQLIMESSFFQPLVT